MQFGIDVLDRSVQQTNQWLDDIAALLDAPDRQLAYQALRALLQALRERLGPGPAADLAAQLPLLIRGLFYDGDPSSATPDGSDAAFIDRLEHAGLQRLQLEPRAAARAVLKVMAERIDPAAMEKIARRFPEELRDLWPDLPHLPAPPSTPGWQTEPPRSTTRAAPRRASRAPRKTEKGDAHRR